MPYALAEHHGSIFEAMKQTAPMSPRRMALLA